MNNDIGVHLIDMDESDPSELGREKILKMIEDSEPLSLWKNPQNGFGAKKNS